MNACLNEIEMNTCKNCGGKFEKYTAVLECGDCEDGVSESVRDIDFDGTGYCKCHICNGTGEIKSIETEFCCYECMKEYEEEVFGI